MEQAKHFESLFEKASEYLETRAGLVKLHTIRRTSDAVSVMISKLLALLITGAVILMLSVALAFFLGDVLGKNYYGFLIVAGIYAIIGLLYSLVKDKWVKEPVGDAIIKKMTSQ